MAPSKRKPRKKATAPTGQVGAGAPTICTPELTAEFANLMAAGNYFETVCTYIGISKQDAYNWLSWGEEGKDATGPHPDIYRRFFDAVTRAEARAEVRAAALLQQASQDRVIDLPDEDSNQRWVQGDWRAIAEFMARRYPKRWSKAERVSQEHTGPNGGPVQVETNTKDMSDEQVAALAANIGAALSGGGGPASSDTEGED